MLGVTQLAFVCRLRPVVHAGRANDAKDFGIRSIPTGYRRGKERYTVKVSGEEFISRFAFHILPPGLMRTRYCGLFAHRCCQENMAKCRLLLGVRAALAEVPSEETGSEVLALEGSEGAPAKKEFEMTCPVCGVTPMIWQGEFPGPFRRFTFGRPHYLHVTPRFKSAQQPHATSRPPPT